VERRLMKLVDTARCVGQRALAPDGGTVMWNMSTSILTVWTRITEQERRE
jgi:hypothetical protein